MLNNCIIRNATNNDYHEVSSMLLDIWTNEYCFKVTPSDCQDVKEVEEYYFSKGGKFLVAVVDDKIIGTIASERLSDGNFVLKRMNVHKDFRGKGVAQMLLDNLLAHKSNSYIYLSTNSDLAVAATKFYNHNQFVEVTRDALPQDFPFFYEDNLFMKKELP